MNNGRCKGCNRLLTDPESIALGYGPSCWQKKQARIAEEIETERIHNLKPTIIDIVKATNVQFKLSERIKELTKGLSDFGIENKFMCRHCPGGEIRSYDRWNGVQASGYGEPQWFYIHCDRCNYDTSLLDLGIKLDDLQD